MRLLRFALVAVTLAGGAASSGCRRSMAPLCRQMCDCSPCTQIDFDACVTKAEAAQHSADKTGCADPFDALVSCLEDNFSCGKNGSGPGTDHCARADRVMVLCDGSVNPFATACAEASVKTQACTGAVPITQVPQKPIPCTGLNACLASCTLSQPCEVLDGTTSTKPLTDCLTKCQMLMGGNPPPPGGGPKHNGP